jgi:CheY-like chemotaxis protein
MPEMDGFQVVRAIREHERASGRHLPGIAFTARSRSKDRELCLTAGMDDFLSKPVKADELWATIDRVVAAYPPKSRSNANLLDPEVIKRTCGGDAGVLERICRKFQTGVPDQMARVKAAWDDRDVRRLREAAHLLRGTLSAFSTIGGTAAANLEDEAARDRIDACQPLVDRLEAISLQIVEQSRALSMNTLRL